MSLSVCLLATSLLHSTSGKIWVCARHCLPLLHLFRGWVFSYRTSDLSLGGAWTPLPGCEAGIWQAGAGVAVDSTGDGSVYVALGNGLAPDPVSGGGYSNAVMRLSSGDLKVLDYFVPYNTAGGCMMAPGAVAHTRGVVLEPAESNTPLSRLTRGVPLINEWCP